MRTEYILTKIHPIKKLFIIESHDYESFAKLFLEIQDEIDVIQNLIFVNDNDLWSQPNKDFIKRNDPDIILNLSILDDEKLSKHFGIFSVKPNTDSYKMGRFGTKLNCFAKQPTFLDRFNINKDEIIEVLSASELENTPESLLASVNYGLFKKGTEESLELSIFKRLKVTYLSNKEEIINSIFSQDKKFDHLTTFLGGFAGSGNGSSVYEIEYNRADLFGDKKKYFFISDKNDFKTISYFWDIRSYYSYSNIAWVPVEFLYEITSLVDRETVFVCLNNDIEDEIKKYFTFATIIQPSRLYFRGRNERWTFFEHTQTISISDNEAIIQHPADKSFYNWGAFILEMIGLKEFTYPKRRNIGKLFYPEYYNPSHFPERFQRISELGLSKYVIKLPFENDDFSVSISLPTFNKIIQHLFEDVGYNAKITPKSSIFEQTINLLGGVSELNIISNKNIFDLLVCLTPTVRTENVVKKLLGGIGDKINSNDVLDIIADIREKGAIYFPSVILTIEDIIAKTSLTGSEKKKLFPFLQKLYDQRIFLRGKYFECPSCGSKLWIQIDEINRINYCIECNNLVNLPVYINDKQDSDYFRLNQLIVRAVDQGQLSTILLLNLFFQQKYRNFDYQSNLEVFKEDTLITDIDLIIKMHRKIGMAECKSTSGFSEKQVDELIKIASTLQCDFIAFSSLLNSKSKEIEELVQILNKKSLEIPAFIFANEVLFNPNSNMIQKYFELWHRDDFQVGPIIVNGLRE